MNPNGGKDTSDAIWEIRDLLRLLAEPAIAQRDQKRREEIKRIVGSSKPKAASVLLMDGSRTQTAIHNETGINQGHLSTLVKQLSAAGLLAGDTKQPNLAISLPSTFFERSNDA